jgi:hypothetical protein
MSGQDAGATGAAWLAVIAGGLIVVDLTVIAVRGAIRALTGGGRQ